MERLSFEEAKRLAIKKWQMHVNCNGFDMDAWADDELYNLECTCGFCERQCYLDGNILKRQCDGCEFGKVAGACTVRGSLYDKWLRKGTKHNAQKILDVIKNLKEDIKL